MTTTKAAAKSATGAFLGDAGLKRRLLTEIRAHAKADQLVKGTYGRAEDKAKFRGCAVGCALDSLNHIRKVTARTDDHARFPAELGIPIELAYLIDHFFECLPDADSQSWPARVITAMPVGAALGTVVPSMLRWTILDPTYGWMEYAKTEDQRQVLQTFATLITDDWAGRTVSVAKWEEIEVALCKSLPEYARTQARTRAWAWAGARMQAEAWARTRAEAEAWAQAWAWARTQARTRAWAWAGARAQGWAEAREEWYTAASAEVLRQIAACGTSR